jgi:hypothetical protein
VRLSDHTLAACQNAISKRALSGHAEVQARTKVATPSGHSFTWAARPGHDDLPYDIQPVTAAEDLAGFDVEGKTMYRVTLPARINATDPVVVTTTDRLDLDGLVLDVEGLLAPFQPVIYTLVVCSQERDS